MTNRQMRELAVLCGSMALLMAVALFLSLGGSSFSRTLAIANASPTAQTASVFDCIFSSANACGKTISPPSIYSFTASAPHVGESADLAWQTGYVDSDQGGWQRGYCYLSGGEFGSDTGKLGITSVFRPTGSNISTPVSHPNGSIRTRPLQAPVTYTLSCIEYFQTATLSSSASVTVTPTYDAGTASANLTADPSTFLAGNQSRLEWSFTKASSCSLTGPSGSSVADLPAAPSAFNFTGADQSWSVPAGITKLYVKLWGAGGAGSTATYGAGGGYTIGNLAVTPGPLTAMIGGGGAYQGGSTYGGGGAANSYTGAGGGRSALQFQSGTDVMTAGGGKGADYYGTPGGAGGGWPISIPSSPDTPSGSSFGAYPGNGSPSTGSGSGYCGGAGVTNCVTTSASGQASAGNTDSDYQSGIGMGGDQGSGHTIGSGGWFWNLWYWFIGLFGGAPGNGGNGQIKIYALDGSGSASTGALMQSGTYTLSCTTPDGAKTASASVTVIPLPVLSLSRSPESVDYGGRATVTWSAEHVTSCTLSGAGIASSETSGSQLTGPLTSDATYTLTCQSPAGPQVLTTTVAVGPPPALSISTSPGSIAYGGSSTVTWSAQNVHSCSVSGPGVSSSALSGAANTGALTSGATYTLTCEATSGVQTKQASVAVSPPPTAALSSNVVAVNEGQSATLSWSSANVSSCSLSGGIWGSGTSVPLMSSGISTGPLTTATNYSLTCKNAAGVTASAAASVAVNPPPSLSIKANPGRVDYNGFSDIDWSATNVTSCVVNNDWGQVGDGLTGHQHRGPFQDPPGETFTLTCQSATFGTVASSTTVHVNPIPQPVLSITASPASIPYGGSSTVTWSAQNVDSCTVAGPGISSSETSGTASTGVLTVGATYALTCQSLLGTQTKQASVAVSPAPTVSLSAASTNVNQDQSTTLFWSTANVASCSLSGGIWGSGTSVPTSSSGISTGALSNSTSYTLTCTNAAGVSRSADVSITVNPPPSLTFSASPSAVDYGGSSSLSWSSANVTSCSLSGGIWGGGSAVGTANAGIATGILTASTNYTLTCQSAAYGPQTKTVSVSVGAPPHLSITATPQNILYGGSSTIAWSAEQVDSCVVNNDWGQVGTGVSGSQNRGPFLDPPGETFTLVCQSTSGQKSAAVTVSVGNPPPKISISADPAEIDYNGFSTISWDASHVDSCAVRNDWGPVATGLHGSQTRGPFQDPPGETFTLTCQSTEFGAVSSSTVVRVSAIPEPVLSITATPQSIPYNGFSDIDWSAANADSCVVNNDWGQVGSGLSGHQHRGPFQDPPGETFTLVCQSPYGQKTSSVTVAVGAAPHQTVSLDASPSHVYVGGSSTLSWTTTDASDCTLSGGAWGVDTPVSTANSGISTGDILADTTYTLTCQSPYGYAAKSDSATVTTQPLPDISFSANPLSLLSGESATLSWSCPNPPYTTSLGDTNYSTNGARSGTAEVTPADTTTYSVTCVVSGSTSMSKNATVTVLPPGLTLTATPTKVKKGKTTTLTWSSENVTPNSCHVTNTIDATVWDGDSGTQTPTLLTETTFTLTCSVPSGPVSKSVTVGIIPSGFQNI